MRVTQLARNMTFGGEMASNSASPLREEFGQIDQLHTASPTDALRRMLPKSWTQQDEPHPFEQLTARQGRPLRVAILSDFTRIPYANGAVFQTRFLYQELRRCGHEVTVIGPYDPEGSPDDLAPGTVELPSLPLKAYPGVNLPMPLASWVYDPDRWNFDLVFAQTTSMLMEFGVWLRKMKGIPLLCVNTTHLVAAYEAMLPETLSRIDAVHAGLELVLRKPFERTFAKIYNESDGLVVLSDGLRRYWRERGVTAPIHVIPRAVQPDVFDRDLGPDPYTFLGTRGGPRLLCAGRHTREKSQDRVIRIFARHILPAEPQATLTLLGVGPDTENYRRTATELGVGDRVFFPGEVPFTQMADFYAHADVFVHASLSETYGNVMGEALWCGTPTVAFADGMGVSSQIEDGVNGLLLAPGCRGPEEGAADGAFGRAVIALLRDPERRAALGRAAGRVAHERAHPRAIQTKLVEAFGAAQDHAAACGLRAVSDGPLPLQWYTTFRHFRPWTTVMSSLYVLGHVRGGSREQRGTKQQKPKKIQSQFDGV
jgi:glycosyltransferase involved in cell wall biosynthesis